MTYWYRAYCKTCNQPQPQTGPKDGARGVLVVFNGELSLYPLYEEYKRIVGEWLISHAGHDIVLLQEDDADPKP